jgi:hypothetical protein
MLAFTPSQFETLICELLHPQGYRHMRCVGGLGDLTPDITGTDPQERSAAAVHGTPTSGAWWQSLLAASTEGDPRRTPAQ